MADRRHWLLDLDTSEDVHVASTTQGIYIFYSENEDEFVRTDTVVNVSENL